MYTLRIFVKSGKREIRTRVLGDVTSQEAAKTAKRAVAQLAETSQKVTVILYCKSAPCDVVFG